MKSIIKTINKFNKMIGILSGWLLIPIVIGTFYNVVVRYYFKQFSIPVGELVIIMNSVVFLLAAPLLLKEDKHVRVDIFYAKLNRKKQAIVDFLGTLFLLFPLFGFILYYSWGYVLSSWQSSEASSQTGGLHGLYLFKSLIIIASVLIVIQGISMLLEKLLIISQPDTIIENNKEKLQ